MIRQFSYGVIPLRLYEDAWQVLIIQHQAGHWGFPKGKAEGDEEPGQTATRELSEETGLQVTRWMAPTALFETYFFTYNGEQICKAVAYFIAQVEGDLQIQTAEVKDAKWVSLTKAIEQLTYPGAKALCNQVLKLIEDSSIQK